MIFRDHLFIPFLRCDTENSRETTKYAFHHSILSYFKNFMSHLVAYSLRFFMVSRVSNTENASIRISWPLKNLTQLWAATNEINFCDRHFHLCLFTISLEECSKFTVVHNNPDIITTCGTDKVILVYFVSECGKT